MESKLISTKIIRPISTFYGAPSKARFLRNNLHLTNINNKSTSNKSSRHASTCIQWRMYMVQKPSRIINYSFISPYCDQNFLSTSLKAEIFNILSPLIVVNTHGLTKLFAGAANQAQQKIMQSLAFLPLSSLISKLSTKINSSIKNFESVNTVNLQNVHCYVKKIDQQKPQKNFPDQVAIHKEIYQNFFYNTTTYGTLRHLTEYLTEIQNVLIPRFVCMNDTPKKDSSDTGGVKDTGDSAPTQNAGDCPKPDQKKDKDKTTKSDSGHESGGTSSPSSEKTPSSGKSSSNNSTSSSEEFPNFQEEIIWEPLPDDIELGFEEEMSPSNRETDHRWYPHLKPPTPQTRVKYYPKLYYEETTTYEPSRASPPPPPAPPPRPPHSKFSIYEDPEPEPEESRHWSQISFDMPPSPIPVAGPSRYDPMNPYDTPPAFRNRTPNSAGRTVRVRRRIEYSPSDIEGSPGPIASTPRFRPPLSSTMTRARRNIFAEPPDDSPIASHEAALVRNSPCPSGRGVSTPQTSPRCPPRNRISFSPEPTTPTGRQRGDSFVFSPEPIAPTGRRPGNPFVFSPEPVARTNRKRGDSFHFSAEPVPSTSRKQGDPFAFSDNEDGCAEDPRSITHIRESITTCDNSDTCIEEIRETTIRKRIFANDGSLPVGVPMRKTQVTKSVAANDGEGDPCGCPTRDDPCAPSTSRGHNGRCPPSSPCSSDQKKKTPIIDSNSPSKNSSLKKNEAKAHSQKDNPTSLSPSLISDKFILYQFETTPDRSEAIIEEISKDEPIAILINFFPNCHISLKEKLLSCTFANYKTTYPLRICFLDLR